MLSDACPGWPHLTKLELAGCYLADEGAIELSVGLVECAGLCLLDLSGNSITDEGTRALAEMLSRISMFKSAPNSISQCYSCRRHLRAAPGNGARLLLHIHRRASKLSCVG